MDTQTLVPPADEPGATPPRKRKPVVPFIAWVTMLLVTLNMMAMSAQIAVTPQSDPPTAEEVAHYTDFYGTFSPQPDAVLEAWKSGDPWRAVGTITGIVGPIFLHGNLEHFAGNMVALLLIGLILERMIGHSSLLAVYLVSGITAQVITVFNAHQAVGASGAIAGLMGAFALSCIWPGAVLARLREGGLLAWLALPVGVALSFAIAMMTFDTAVGVLNGHQEVVVTPNGQRFMVGEYIHVIGTLVGAAAMALIYVGRGTASRCPDSDS